MTVERASSVLPLALRVRDLVNQSRRLAGLRREPAKFNTVCAAMDLVEDADMGVREYLAQPPGSPIGYLTLYGVMQALFVQQDGVRYLLQALDLKRWPDPNDDRRIGRPRDTRSAATGHPVAFKRGGKQFSFHVSRGTMKKEGFTLLGVEHGSGESTVEDVKVLDLIAGQEECLAEVLRGAIRDLELQEREHRQAFRDEKLSVMLHPSYPYLVQKIAESGRSLDPGDTVPAAAALASIRKAVARISEALDRRGLGGDTLPGASHALLEIHEVLAGVEMRLERGSPRCNDPDRAVLLRSLAWLLKKELEGVAEMLADLDREYESEDVR